MSLFCEHLRAYADAYERTRADYQVCLDLMDRILGGESGVPLVAGLEQALNDWELENRQLRELFKRLVSRQAIQLPTAEGEPVPPGRGQAGCTCAACGLEVPRLEFPEWDFNEDGQVSFRGQTLVPAAPQPV